VQLYLVREWLADWLGVVLARLRLGGGVDSEAARSASRRLAAAAATSGAAV
jgi:hypothetical protein